MNWNACRDCHDGTMQPTGATRPAPYDPAITEIAHHCDTCTKHRPRPEHPGLFTPAPSGAQSPPRRARGTP